MRKSRSFTIMEMLIVIAILAILYSIASASVTGMQDEARIARTKGDLATLRLALDGYVKNYGRCPLEDNYQRYLLTASPRILDGNLMDMFARSVNTPYSYGTSNNRKYYVVYSVGEKRTGRIYINEEGVITKEGTAIFQTNGYF